MSLIKPMILLITINLSNGGKVIYEMNNKYYSQVVKFVDRENIHHHLVTFCELDSGIIYEYVNKGEDVKFFSREITPVIENWEGEEAFQKSLTPFFMEDFEGLEQLHSISPGIELRRFYIHVQELSELYVDRDINNIAPIINSEYILASFDVSSIEEGSSVRPIKVEVEWKKSFSKFIVEEIKKKR